jgi:uncharacterized RDD family membrane protein YckC
MSMEPDIPSIFEELEQQRPVLVNATAGQRFVNFIIDTIVNVCGILFISAMLGVIDRVLQGSVLDNTQTDFGTAMWQALYNILITSLIYGLTEGLTKGRTLGKMVTGTRVVKEDGSTITLKDAFTRSICRQIPFEALSILSSNGMWHDVLAKTRVVQIR